MPMKIITRDFGEQEIEEDKIITFPEGIIGFENVKRYALLSPLGDGVQLLYMKPSKFQLLNNQPVGEHHR